MRILDLYQVESLFTEEELLVRDTVRSFVEKNVLPNVREWNREARFPVEMVPEIAALGFLGAYLKGYDCPGISYNAYGLMMKELERGDSGFRSFVSVQNGLCMYPIFTFGSEEQKNYWLPRMAQGKAVGCFGLTEPDYGSNPDGMITTGRRENGEWVLNGAKMWITNGSIADVAVVFARTDEGIRAFLVEKGTPGFTAPEITGKLSLRVSVTSELIFQDCRIPAENILPGAKGLKAALMCLNQARYSIAWGVIGAALACFEETLAYAKERVQFTKPIAGYQLVQEKFSDMWTGIIQAYLLAHRLGQLMDQGKADPAAISLAKRNNVRTALYVARTCRDLLGASGILDEYHTMRHMNNLESVFTYEGTDHIHTLILGEKLTGIAAFA